MALKSKLENKLFNKLKADKKDALFLYNRIYSKIKEEYSNLRSTSAPFSLKPVFLSEIQNKRIKEATGKIVKIVKKISRLYFKDNEIQEIIDVPQRYEKLMEINPGYNIDFAIARFDLFLKGNSLKFLEFNSSPGMMGDYDLRNRLFLEERFFKEILKDYRLEYLNLKEKLLETLLECYRSWGGKKKRPNIGLLILPQIDTLDKKVFIDYFNKKGFPSFLIDPRELRYNGKNLTFKDTEIDLIYNRLVPRRLIGIENKIHPFIDAYKEGKVCLVNNFHSLIVGSKRLLWGLSSGRLDKFLTEDEIDSVKKYIPWTTILKPGGIKLRGKLINLIPYLKNHKDNFVIKPERGQGGKGVSVGKETEQKEWINTINNCLKKGKWLIQKFVAQPEEVFPEFTEKRLSFVKKKVNHNALVLNGEYVGCLTRISDSYISNISQGGGAVPTFVIKGQKKR